MLQTRSSATSMVPRTARFLSLRLLALLFVLTSLPIVPAALADHPTPPKAASPQPQETPIATPTPTEEELKLQQEKKILELQRDIELAKKAIRDAQPQSEKPPAPTATPLAGDTTMSEGVRLETEMVSYKAMSEAANKIVTDIDGRLKDDSGNKITIKNIAIYDAQVIKDWRFYGALFPSFRAQAEDILKDYKNLLCRDKSGVDDRFRNTLCTNNANERLQINNERFDPSVLKTEAIASALAVGGNLVKSFIDLAALFRTETKIEGKSVTIDESALVAEVFRAMKNKDQTIKLYYPEVFPPRVPTGDSETVKLIGLLFLYKAEADRLISEKTKEKEKLLERIKEPSGAKDKLSETLDKVEELNAELKNLEEARDAEDNAVIKRRIIREIADTNAELGKLPLAAVLKSKIEVLNAKMLKDKTRLDAINKEIKDLTRVNERFQNFADEFIKVDTNGVNALALFIKSEDIENAMNDNNSFWLEIKSVSAGGNNRVRKNLIWFFAGARVDHSGGIIVEYTLYDKTGAVRCSDKLFHYEGYKTPKQIRTKKTAEDKEFKDPDN
jgi:hypothetical protein